MWSMPKGIGKVGLLAPKLSGLFSCPAKGASCSKDPLCAVKITVMDTLLTSFKPVRPGKRSGSK